MIAKIAAFAGVCCLAAGFLMWLAMWAGGAPQEGDNLGRKGCAVFIVGVVLIIAAVIGANVK